jgi:hypothetical protein
VIGRRAAPALACTLACAACGSHTARRAPSQVARSHVVPSHVAPSAVAEANATHEYPSAPPPAQTATRAAPTAAQAVRAFVTAYINWNAQTVSADMRSLSARSVGQARAAMTLAAAETAGDYELRQGGIANGGTVEAVAPLSGHRNEYVVVTLESTSATNTSAYQGLKPAWHVALATVQRMPGGGWALSDWQPES